MWKLFVISGAVVAGDRPWFEHFLQCGPSEIRVASIIEIFVVTAEHTLQILPLLPVSVEVFCTVGMCRAVSFILGREFLDGS